MDTKKGLIRYEWDNITNIATPTHYVDDFSADKGFFTEENNTGLWKIKNGILTSSPGQNASITYLHIFERNVSFKARMRISSAPPNSLIGLLLRYTSDEAYLRAGCFAFSGRWFIDSREGADFAPYRFGFANKPIEAGRWYDVEFIANENTACLFVDNEKLLESENVGQLTPGRVGIFAENTTIEVDNVDVTFLGGQGTLWRNVLHHKLPDNLYREGGSVFEMSDGILIYEHHSGATFKSDSSGANWERTDKWIDAYHYLNVLRLRSGKFMSISRRQDSTTGKHYIISQTSADDGSTWKIGGDICKSPFKWETKAVAANVNDKITQISDGRIFYAQNYAAPDSSPVDGKCVFCEFFYSDDDGSTWNKSKTDSWTIPGNEDVTHFGECKILECDDGSLRMYNSWNSYGCVVYSESFDKGETWGPLLKIPELVCARSSMQFYRDPYADNETTYYMVWVFSAPIEFNNNMARSRLSLARSYDGKNWHFLGDIWRWESNYICNSFINHVVDPFVKTTKDLIICGAGFSDQLESETVVGNSYHHAQRQHIYTIKKSSLADLEIPKL